MTVFFKYQLLDTSKDKLDKISETADMLSMILGIVVALAIVFVIVYLIYFHKTTKKGKRDGERFEKYTSSKAKITSVEKASYIVHPYENQEDGEEEQKQEPHELEKSRYEVRYEFNTDSGKTYYGEFYLYEENKNIAVGEELDVSYDPSNPMVNFTKFNAPVAKR